MTRQRWILLVALAFLVAGLLFLPWQSRSPPSPPPAGPANRVEAEPAGPSGPGAQLPNLDPVLALAPDCRMEAPLRSIFERMTILDPDTHASRPGPAISVPGFAATITPSFKREVIGTDHGEERWVEAELPIPGLWRGLRVERLKLAYLEESDVSAQEIHFREPPERVRSVLNRYGFALPPVGQSRDVGPPEGLSASIAIEPAPSGAMLACRT